MSAGTDKRQHARFKLHIPLKYWEIKNGKPAETYVETVCRDLSTGGLGFESRLPLSVGTALRVEIHPPGRKESVISRAQVMRLESVPGKDHFLVGAAFSDIKIEDLTFLASCLESMNLFTLLDQALKEGASDLHLTIGCPPVIRVEGKIHFMKGNPIQDGQIKAMVYPLLSRTQTEYLEEKKELDFAFSPTPDSRFRVNLHFQKGFLEAALRSITAGTKSFSELGLPVDVMERFCRERSGLILIGGKTGSGKSTTMTSMVDFINNNLERVVITVEDPVEHIHLSKKSVVKQRELGSDTQSFAEALKYSLRQDPDIVVVGELRDKESVISAIRAAETGHLIISTVHAADATQVLERVVTLFPPEEALTVGHRLASCLIGVLFQILMPGKQGKQILGTELLINTPAVRTMIREGGFAKIKNSIQTGAAFGMYTLQDNLRKLCEKGLLEQAVMQEYSKTE